LSGACALAGEKQRVSFYALRPGGWRDYVTLLHPPYTVWHLAYVAIGASLASQLDLSRLTWTIAAFFLAVGISAHCLDELHDRPLRTAVPRPVLVVAATVSLGAAGAIGLAGVGAVGIWLLAFVAAGIVLVMAYNLELAGGMLHTDHVFALAWGAFPVVVGGFAQDGAVTLPIALGAAFAAATSYAQRHLSNWARRLRRRSDRIRGDIKHGAGRWEPATVDMLARPAERALLALAVAHALLAAALVALRLE
jgi:hypothetical protein